MSTRLARRLRRGALAIGGALALSGCWLQDAAGPDRTNANPTESHLTPANVGSLAEVWRVDGYSPVVNGGTVYAHATEVGDNAVRALEPRTGVTRWQTSLGLGTGTPGPFVLDPGAHTLRVSGSAFTGGDKAYTPTVALDTGSGGVIGSGPSDTGQSALVSRRGSQDLLYNERRGYRAEGGRGYARWVSAPGHALDGVITEEIFDSGWLYPTLGTSLVWSPTPTGVGAWSLDTSCPSDGWVQRCEPTWSRDLGALATSVVVGPGEQAIYTGTSSGTAYALDPATGATKWSTPLGAGSIDQAPAFDGSTLFFSTGNGSVVAIDAGNGSVRWRSTAATAGAAQPAVAGGVVYAASTDGVVRAFDAGGCPASPCSPRWSADAGATASGLVVDGGRLFVDVSDANGNQIVSYATPGT